MIPGTNVGIPGDESAADGRRRELDPDLSARRHPLACVACDVDEHTLEALRIDLDVERAGRLRQDQLDLVADETLEHGREIPQYALRADGLERTHLLVSIRPELPQKTRRPRHVGQQTFGVPSQRVVAIDHRQPFVGTEADVTEQRVARDATSEARRPTASIRWA